MPLNKVSCKIKTVYILKHTVKNGNYPYRKMKQKLTRAI